MLRTLLAHRVRGQALSELQVAVLVGAIVLAAFVFLFARQVAASAAVNTYAANEAAVVAVFKEAEDDAAAAQAVFSPSNDVGGNSNADGHAADFYQQDGTTHAGHFYELCFKASSSVCPTSQAIGTLQRYTYVWSNLPQNGGSGATAQSKPITLFSGFTFHVLTTPAQYADPALDPYAYAYFAKHSASFPSARQFHWGYPGVTSGTNDLYVFSITLPNNEQRSIAIGKHHIVFAQQLIYGSATPTPNPMCAAACPNGSSSLAFRNPIDNAQSASIVEQNYGTRSTTPPQVYAISGCSGIAALSPASPITPSNNGTGSATIVVAPVKQVAPSGLSCAVTAMDNANQRIPISVSVGQTYTPQATGGGVVPFGSNASTTVSEKNYDAPPAGGFRVASVSGPCSPSAASSGMSADGTFTYSTHYNVTFSQAGIVCVITFADTYGQQTQIQAEEAAGLQSWPAFVELPMSGQSLQTSMRDTPRDLAYYLNSLLGGGVAEAALSPCGVNQGRAFRDSGFTQVDANDRDPFGQGFTTDGNGCISGPGGATVLMSEPGYSGVFSQVSSYCGSAVKVLSYNPASAVGPTVSMVAQGGSLMQSCSASWGDQNATHTTSIGFEVSGCVNTSGNNYQLVGIGGTCTGGTGWQSTVPDCTPGGSGGIEYTDKGVTYSGPGSVADNGDGTVTALRSGVGTISASLSYSELMCNWATHGTRLVNASESFTFSD